MAASSVTGVGQGSADKKGQRGSEHLFVGVEKLIGTHVVYSNSVTLTGTLATTVTIPFPQSLPGVYTDYIVLTSGGAHGYSYGVVSNPGGGAQPVQCVIGGTGPDTIGYAIVRVTNASISGGPPGAQTFQ